MTTSGLTGTALTRPSATLSPSDGERDGVRGVWSIPPLVFGNWSELPPERAGRRAIAQPRLPRGQAFLATPARPFPRASRRAWRQCKLNVANMAGAAYREGHS